MRVSSAFVILVACSSQARSDVADPLSASDQQGIIVREETTRHEGACDGSAAAVLDEAHFINLGDETQQLSVYRRGEDGGAEQTLDLSAALGLAQDDEADIEDAAKVGERVYVVTSHGRNKDGELAPARQRFFALDVAEDGISVAGTSSNLLVDMLDERRWEHPDAAVIDQLRAATRFDVASAPELAPQRDGLNIEGLASWPTEDAPERLLLGLRNPTIDGHALLVSLLNPREVVAGEAAQFGEAIRLDLKGLGIRTMVWSAAHHALMLVAGSAADGGKFRLFAWHGSEAEMLRDIDAPKDSAPEALLAYADGEVVVLLDRGDAKTSDSPKCKNQPASQQWFPAQSLPVDMDFEARRN